jgi:hypothetical protein
MATLQDHARLPVFFNQQYLEEVTDVRVRTDSGQQPVETLEGLVGFTSGSGRVEITISFAIPIGGTEAEFQENCAEGNYVDMQVGVGAKAYAGRGKVTECEFGQGTNAASEGSLTWVGELKPIE